MSEQSAEVTATETETESTSSDQQAEAPKPTDTVDFWKAKAREQEKRAKENKAAADELSQLREAQKTAEQKAAEREAAAVKRAEEAEARARRREIALDPTGDGKAVPLSPEDAAYLDYLTDEDAMRNLATRLANREADRKKNGNHAPHEGNTPKSGNSDEASFARGLFSSGDQI